MRLKEWLDKGEGGEWFEPYVTNRDWVFIYSIVLLISLVIIGGCFLVSQV